LITLPTAHDKDAGSEGGASSENDRLRQSVRPLASMVSGLRAFFAFRAFRAFHVFHASRFFVASENEIDCVKRDGFSKSRLSLPVRGRCVMRSKLGADRSPVSPDDYRQFAVDSVRRCLAMPNHLTRSRMLHLMLAKAWHKLADQAEELRKQHPPSAPA
jgi:hypothetical protein